MSGETSSPGAQSVWPRIAVVLLGVELVRAEVLFDEVGRGRVVVVEEEHDLAAGQHHRQVLRGAAAGVLDPRPHQRQPCGELAQHAQRLLSGRAVVHDDDLELGDGQRLLAQSLQALGEAAPAWRRSRRAR